MKKRSIFKKLLIILVTLLVLSGSSFFLYFSVYYKAQTEITEKAAYAYQEEKNYIALMPASYETAIVFYPGAKVESRAYVSLFDQLAQKGILCIILKPAFHFALFDADAADKARNDFPDVKNWYIGGHSLGGVCASLCAGKNKGAYKGLILLASYSSVSLKDSGLRVLEIYGSNDEVMNREKHDEHLKDLPSDYETLVIEGGNHAQFADYGFQKGDGKASITSQRQKQLCAEAILDFISG